MKALFAASVQLKSQSTHEAFTCIRDAIWILILRINMSRFRSNRTRYRQTLVHSKNLLRPWSRARLFPFRLVLVLVYAFLCFGPHHVIRHPVGSHQRMRR
jgi:hypothetical protein